MTALGDITCPACGERIPVGEAISRHVASEVQQKFAVECAERLLAIEQREEELKKQEETQEKIVQQRLNNERSEIELTILTKARAELSFDMQKLENRASQQRDQLRLAREAELALRRTNRELELRDQAREDEFVRRLNHEQLRIEEETAVRTADSSRLREAEYEKRLKDAIRANDELRRKLEQGSQQLQGEVLEADIAELLTKSFPTDLIERVRKGILGADIVHRVVDQRGQICGVIIWEIKRTKAWNDSWLRKLKGDQRRIHADIAVLVSDALPIGVTAFRQIKDVWLVNRQCATSLACALRLVLTETAQARRNMGGQGQRLELLHQYLTGADFKQRVEAIIESFISLQQDLNEERRSTERRWSKRERQLQQVIANTSGMYGDLQGLVGPSLQTLKQLDDHSPGAPDPDHRGAGRDHPTG